jgi:RNA polymerase sigma factor (sigma-70 family)|tara:strand:- start:5944 stop:6498 length:555 start_codon:yes stop_codon:yes gene_type:complete
MNKIYEIVADCRQTFVEMSFTFTQDENEINEVVQELMLYFMQMNPDTLKSIYEKDGKKGILSYGAVVLRRSFTSNRSPYYYKYKKYYTHIDSRSTDITNDSTDVYHKKHLYNIPNAEQYKQWQKLELIDKALDEFYWYDRDVFKLYYYEGNTLSGLAKKTGISRNSLFTTIDKVREQLKDLLNE